MDNDPVRLRLDDQLCFALYAATNSVVRAYRPLLEQIGLTYPQYLALMVLWESDDLAVGDIAERLRLPAHGLSPLIHRLEDAGLVSLTTDPGDRRSRRVRLTPAGRLLETAAAAAQREVACRTTLGDAALADLRERLHDLVDQMAAPGLRRRLGDGPTASPGNRLSRGRQPRMRSKGAAP